MNPIRSFLFPFWLHHLLEGIPIPSRDRTMPLGRYILGICAICLGPHEESIPDGPKVYFGLYFACFLLFCIPCRWILSGYLQQEFAHNNRTVALIPMAIELLWLCILQKTFSKHSVKQLWYQDCFQFLNPFPKTILSETWKTVILLACTSHRFQKQHINRCKTSK